MNATANVFLGAVKPRHARSGNTACRTQRRHPSKRSCPYLTLLRISFCKVSRFTFGTTVARTSRRLRSSIPCTTAPIPQRQERFPTVRASNEPSSRKAPYLLRTYMQRSIAAPRTDTDGGNTSPLLILVGRFRFSLGSSRFILLLPFFGCRLGSLEQSGHSPFKVL